MKALVAVLSLVALGSLTACDSGSVNPPPKPVTAADRVEPADTKFKDQDSMEKEKAPTPAPTTPVEPAKKN
ncbi:MAG: hypothetical protein JNM94_14655 [Phycisphaerae bacterium]|nr:hypothetical protein [Phycisphaerae bacterium]